MELARNLLIYGANPVYKSTIENSAFYYALNYGRFKILKYLIKSYKPTELETARLLGKFRNLPEKVVNYLNYYCGGLNKHHGFSSDLSLGTMDTQYTKNTRPQTAKNFNKDNDEIIDVIQVLGTSVSPINKYHLKPKTVKVIRLPTPRLSKNSKNYSSPINLLWLGKSNTGSPTLSPSSGLSLSPTDSRIIKLNPNKASTKKKEIRKKSRNSSGTFSKKPNDPIEKISCETMYFSYISPEKGEISSRKENQIKKELCKNENGKTTPIKFRERPKTAVIRHTPNKLLTPTSQILDTSPQVYQEKIISRKSFQRPRSAVSPMATPVYTKLGNNSPKHYEKLEIVGANNSDDEYITDRTRYLSVPKIACEVTKKPIVQPRKYNTKSSPKRIRQKTQFLSPSLQKKRPETASTRQNDNQIKKHIITLSILNSDSGKEYRNTAIDTQNVKVTNDGKIINLLRTIGPDLIRNSIAKNYREDPKQISGIRGMKTVFSPRSGAIKPLFFTAYSMNNK